MKLIIIILAGLLTFAFVYIVIPDTIQQTEIVKINGNEKAGNRMLMNETEWKKWWPSCSSNTNNLNAFRYNDYKYALKNKDFEGVEIEITKGGTIYSSIFRIIPVESDTSVIEWRLIIKNNSNPVSRINNYIQAHRIEGNMKKVLQSFIEYLGSREKVYGIKIESEKVKDTLLISTKTFTKNFASVQSIYNSINSLRCFIKSRQAKETSYPMLHVEKTIEGYGTMVAIPVDKQLESNGQYLFKRMVPGNILVTEVRGGTFRVQEAFKQMKNFVDDYGFVSPAIPFESLVTDRNKEQDTSKWITKIFYPVL